MKTILGVFALAAMIASCNMPDKSADMKADAGKAKMQRFYDEVFNAHNAAAMDSFCTADFIDHNPGPGHDGKGLESVKADVKEFMAEYPDLHIKSNFMVSDGDKVVAHITLTGTNSGAMGTQPATNKTVDFDGIDVVTIKDGKATERWGYFDDMKMMRQLGMMPEHGAMPDQTAMKPEGEKK